MKDVSPSNKYLNQPEGFIGWPAHGQVVDGDVPELAVSVDDEKAAERNPVAVPQDSVVARDLSGDVGQQRDVHRAEATLLARRVDPGQVCKVGVGWTGNDLE